MFSRGRPGIRTARLLTGIYGTCSGPRHGEAAFPEVDSVIAPERTRHGQAIPLAPRGRIPANLSARDRMRRKLRTKRGRQRYGLRKQTVEPVFGQIQQGRGLRQFLLRSLEKVNREWLLICTGHNLLKLFRYGGWLGAPKLAGHYRKLPRPADAHLLAGDRRTAAYARTECYARRGWLPSRGTGSTRAICVFLGRAASRRPSLK